ncbi:MAG: ECF transporter S component, partial [Finegoldia magna]|nr:ECF transporter S component [Finegoldia magna]
MRNNSTKKMVFAAVGIAINIILGIFVGGLKIPLLFMDTVGTVFTAVVLGPFWGACTGALTNVILGVLKDPR